MTFVHWIAENAVNLAATLGFTLMNCPFQSRFCQKKPHRARNATNGVYNRHESAASLSFHEMQSECACSWQLSTLTYLLAFCLVCPSSVSPALSIPELSSQSVALKFVKDSLIPGFMDMVPKPIAYSSVLSTYVVLALVTPFGEPLVA